ncbi:hypothetical protein U1Q18_025650 [Sarracenia purpurea var. burkii]
MVASISVEEEIKSDKGRDLDAVSLDRYEVRGAPLVAKVHSISTEIGKIEDEADSNNVIEVVSTYRGEESSTEESLSMQEGFELETDSGENEKNEQRSVGPKFQENKPQTPGVSLPSDQSYRSARLQCSRAPVQRLTMYLAIVMVVLFVSFGFVEFC